MGTVNRSMAAISSLWLRKKAIHRFSWSGSAGRRGRYRDTVLSEMTKPSLVSSAWMRGAPQPSCAIVRTRRRISASIRGRPGWRRCKIFAQHRRNRSRCQRATVSAWTMSRRLAHTGHEPRRATQKARLRVVERWAWALFLQRRHLLPQSDVLQHQVGAAADTSPEWHGRQVRRGRQQR